MNILNIGCDLDNCIINFDKTWLSCAEEYFKESNLDASNLKLNRIEKSRSYNYNEELNLDKNTNAAIWNKLYQKPNLFKQMPLMNRKDWLGFCNLLNHHPRIVVYFITNRVSGTPKKSYNIRSTVKQTSEFLTNIGWKNPQIIVTRKKYEIINTLNIKYMLDDAPHNIMEILSYSLKCTPVIYNYGYNTHILGVKRVSTLTEYANIVLKGLK